jgi:cob(I)alamin adenosyltransferase
MIQVYTGNGKGKTTASLGLALRACGQGLSVFMIQFMKGSVDYGETRIASQIPNLTIRQFGRPELVDKKNPLAEDIKGAQEALDCAGKVLQEGAHHLVILDEINVALDFRLIDLKSVLSLIEKKPAHVELVLTGRYAAPEILEKADLVTEMREVRHYYQKGVPARKGFEF